MTYTYVGELPATSPIEVMFPTGRFVSEDGDRAFEFDADGNWRFYENDLENPAISGLYVTVDSSSKCNFEGRKRGKLK